MAIPLRSTHHIWHKYQGAKQGRFRPKTGNKNFGLLSQISLPLYFRLKFCMDEKTWLSSQHQYSITDFRMSLNAQELRKQVTASCAGEDIVRSQLVGGEGAGRESEVCVPASSASQTAPHHLTSVCYSAPLYITLHCIEPGRFGAALGFAMFWNKSSGSLVSLNKCNLTV